MLVRNGRSIFQNPGKFSGNIANTTISGNNFKGGNRNRFFGGFSETFGAYPSGYLAPSAFILPQKAGAMSSYTIAYGSISANADLIPAMNLIASSSMQLVVTNAQLDQIVSAIASGSATISTVNAILAGAATLQASGTLTLTASAASGAIFSVTASSSGVLSGNLTISALGFMEAEAGGPTPLSPEGLAQAVWNEPLASYTTSGTAGKKLNDLSGGGGGGGATAAEIAEAVWNEVTSTHTTAGSFGKLVADIKIELDKKLSTNDFIALTEE